MADYSNLKDDPVYKGRAYYSASFVYNKTDDISSKIPAGIKIRASYTTLEEAQSHVERLRDADPYFDIFIGEMGKWCPLSGVFTDESKVIYDDPEEQKLMDAQREQRMKTKEVQEVHDFHEERRQMLLEKQRKGLEELNTAVGDHIEQLQENTRAHKERVSEVRQNTAQNRKEWKEHEERTSSHATQTQETSQPTTQSVRPPPTISSTQDVSDKIAEMQRRYLEFKASNSSQ